MPKILLKENHLTGQFRCSVDSRLLARLDKAVAAAKQSGLIVDYREDVETLLRRLIKVVESETTKVTVDPNDPVGC